MKNKRSVLVAYCHECGTISKIEKNDVEGIFAAFCNNELYEVSRSEYKKIKKEIKRNEQS